MAKKKKTSKKKTAGKKTSRKKTTKKKSTRKKTSKKKSTKKARQEPVVMTSKVKAFMKGMNMMTAADTVDALNAKVYDILEEAAERAQSNKRSTVRPKDL